MKIHTLAYNLVFLLLLSLIVSTDAVATTYYVHNDHLGMPKAITDAEQTLVWKARATPFGEAVNTTGAMTFNVRFPGQYYDQETGLHYNYYRYYDPSTGRYITSDPIGLAGGINTYSYVNANPVRLIDPPGLWSTEAHNYLIRRYGERNGLPQAQTQAVMRGSAYADSFIAGFQGDENSFMHAMTSKAIPNKAEACQLANQFINQNLDYYQDLLSGSMPLNIGGHRGRNLRKTLYNPYFRLGMAMHTVMDNRSPAHAGFQTWDHSQIGRHGDNIPLTPFGSHTEEDLNALLARPDLIGQIINDMSNLMNTGQAIDCDCYE